MNRDISLPITIDDIDIPDGRRQVNPAAVKRLADSIDKIGLRHPITVREKGERYQLIAGRHRIEAFRKLEREHIPAIIVRMTNDDARLWEIAENLHRAELTKLERDEQVAEWIRITERLSSQSEAKVARMGRPESGVNAAARDLGIDDADAHRAVKVASLSEEAKDAAREVGLDDNRSALLEAASKPTVAEQVAAIHQRHTAQRVVKIAKDPISDVEALESQVAALMNAWNRASSDARQEFLGRIDSPLMDRKWA
jgi:ParB-like chromosome segregation protein Spo0J